MTTAQKLGKGLYRVKLPLGWAWIERDEHSGSDAWWVSLPGRRPQLVPSYQRAMQIVDQFLAVTR